MEIPRRKSPRSPSIPLDEAIDRVLKAYERERLHPAPTEIVAQNIGYKSANSGTALSALASLRYFGLLERPKEGVLAISKDFESFKFAPDEHLKKQLLVSFLRRPQLYNELLDKYESGLPSDANLKFELIQRGFAPHAAEVALMAFRRSVEFSGYFDSAENIAPAAQIDSQFEYSELADANSTNVRYAGNVAEVRPQTAGESIYADQTNESGLDRIPVRLTGGRRAWLLIPMQFFNSDKARIKAQIDLLLTEEDESEEE